MSPGRVRRLGKAKPLVDEAIHQDPHLLPRGSRCFSTLPRCRCLARPWITPPGVIRPGRKHRKHGMNLQVIASPDGDIVWVSGPLPGAVHDLTAARIWGCHDGLDGNRPRPHPETDR